VPTIAAIDFQLVVTLLNLLKYATY